MDDNKIYYLSRIRFLEEQGYKPSRPVSEDDDIKEIISQYFIMNDRYEKDRENKMVQDILGMISIGAKIFIDKYGPLSRMTPDFEPGNQK